jgi:hypothetical protein
VRKRDERISRIRAIDREHQVVAVALSSLQIELRADPSKLGQHGLRFQDFQHVRNNTEATYFIRLFAEFESGLREAWKHAYGRKTHPTVSDLLSAFSARCRIPDSVQERVENVRRYRNSLVHESDQEAHSIGLGEARARLCRFFSFLPD